MWIWILLFMRIDVAWVDDEYEGFERYPTLVMYEPHFIYDQCYFQSYSSPWNERLKEELKKNPGFGKVR